MKTALRTASHAASTAPPVIHVWREADVDPESPIEVSACWTTTCSTPSSGAHDLRHHGGEALPALRGGAVDVGDGGAVEDPQPDASRPEVVDAARVADRLHAERIADPAPDALAVGDVAEPAGKRPQVELAAIALGGQRQVAQVLEQLAQRRWSVNGLASREYGALDERVAQSQLQGVDAHCGSEPVDRRLDGVAGLHGAEAAHRTARGVVREHRIAVDAHVGNLVGAGGEVAGVGDDDVGSRRVGAPVEEQPHVGEHDQTVVRRAELDRARAGWRRTCPKNDSSRL